MASELVTQGIAALKAGDRTKARQLLASAIKQNPNDERAWSWLYNAVETKEQKFRCLQEVIRINPTNDKARQALDRLQPKPTSSAIDLQKPVSSPDRPADKPLNHSSSTLGITNTNTGAVPVKKSNNHPNIPSKTIKYSEQRSQQDTINHVWTAIRRMNSRQMKWAGCGVGIVMLLCCGSVVAIGQTMGLIESKPTKDPRSTTVQLVVPPATFTPIPIAATPIPLDNTSTLQAINKSMPIRETFTPYPTQTPLPPTQPTLLPTSRPGPTTTRVPLPTRVPTSTIGSIECCKHCGPNSKPCGDSCISKKYTCHKPPGCACP